MSINTVFIVGAGASEEANLPTGNQLKNFIAQLLDIHINHDILKNGDRIIFNALQKFVKDSEKSINDIGLYIQESWHIRDALPQAISIDNFIDAHRDNDKIALCGKLAIIRAILSAEEKSLLYFERADRNVKMNFISLKDTWYIPFFQLLTENCGKNDLKERFESIKLIIFNYDRCIEHFIYNALLNYYNISKEEAEELVKSIAIYHPYGNVGSLPWMSKDGAIEFGKKPTAQELLQLTKKIKTFAEGTDPNASEISNIRQHIALAYRVVFLGFAFHKLNMQLIYPGSFNAGKIVNCYATAYELSDSDKKVIKEQIEDIYKRTIIVEMAKSNVRCCQFFKEFRRSLAF